MHTNAMQIMLPACQLQLAMQHAALLTDVGRNILVDSFNDGELGKQCIAMMPCRVDGILAVSMIRPYGFGQKLCLALLWPIIEALTMPDMLTAHFLQENDIRMQSADQFALLVQRKAGVEAGDTLVDIKGCYA